MGCGCSKRKRIAAKGGKTTVYNGKRIVKTKLGQTVVQPKK